MSRYEELFNLLPERYRKPNTKKLYYAIFDDRADLKRALKEVETSRDIEKAYGKTLDRIGGNVGQIRQGEEDDLYRQLIKVRIIANLSMGNIPTLNLVLSTLVKDVYLGLVEAWDKEDQDFEPSKIVIKLDWKAKTFPFELVERIKSAGVRVLAEIHLKAKQEMYFAGGRRRILRIKYLTYQNTEIKGRNKPYFAGYLVSSTMSVRPPRETNIRAKNSFGRLYSNLGRIRGGKISE